MKMHVGSASADAIFGSSCRPAGRRISSAKADPTTALKFLRTALTLSPLLLVTWSSSAQTDDRTFYHHAALNPWLMALLFIAAAALIIWLYRAQQRIASRRLVGALTAIRVLLLIAMFVLLLQPAMRWVHHSNSSGTLWLMLDATGSMATTDPQSTPIERLRWADSLEYIPTDFRPAKLDQTIANLICLRDDLPRLRSESSYPQTAGRQAPNEQFTAAIKSWRAAMTDASAQLSADGKSIPAAAPFSNSLLQTAKLADDSLAAAAAKDLSASIAAVPWQRLEADLDMLIKALTPLADAADNDFLKAHAQDSAVKEALARISILSRSQLALLDLTQKAQRSASSLSELFPSYRIRLATFTDKAQSANSTDAADLLDALKRALSTNGQATSLAAGLEMISEQLADDPTSVLILSDGKQNVEGDAAAAAQQLASRGAHVYALAIGSSKVAIDAAVETIDAPDWVYKDDTVRASARIRADGLAGKPISVELWRENAKLDTKTFTPTKQQETRIVTFEDAHPELGVHDYEIRIPETSGEENKDNNRESFRVSVKKDRLKMLIVEDQPRWEYRHLVSYVSRDPRVKLQTILLQPTRIKDVTGPAPAKASPVNARTEAQILPQKKEDWLAFDVIILGDVSATDLPAEQQQNLAASIKDGKSLVIIAGQHNMPGSYLSAPLAEILPVTLASDWSPDTLAEHLKLGFHPQVTPEGSASILSQFKLDAAENAAVWSAAPPWYWHSEQTQAKPAATILWSLADSEGAAHTESASLDAARRRALLAITSLGSGRVLYLASDQTWRMRQVNGENLQERFWGQVIRWAAGNDLPAGSEHARFGSDKPRYVQGDTITITAKLLKDDLTPLTNHDFEVVARTQLHSPIPSPGTPGEGKGGGGSAISNPQSEIADSKTLATAKFIELPDSPGQYRATLIGLPSGQTEVSLRGRDIEHLLADVTTEKQKSLSLRIQPQLTVEQRDTNTDKPKLAEITKAGAGILLDGPYASTLARYIPQPKLQQTSIEQLGFFGDPRSRATKLTHWIFLAAFCVLITAEWIIRKAGGLV